MSRKLSRALRPHSPLVQHGYSTPIVYRLNLREANSLFVAQSFQVLNRDLLYVSNAPIASGGLLWRASPRPLSQGARA
jgi:polysaccharide export outer membrane protein